MGRAHPTSCSDGGQTCIIDSKAPEEHHFEADGIDDCRDEGKFASDRTDIECRSGYYDYAPACWCKTEMPGGPNAPQCNKNDFPSNSRICDIIRASPNVWWTNEGDCESFSSTTSETTIKEQLGIPLWREDISCFFGYEDYEPTCKCQHDPNSGFPDVDTDLPITWPSSGPGSEDCKRQLGIKSDREDIICTYANGQCTCDVEEEGTNVPDECAAGNCPITYVGGPEVQDCYEQGQISASDQADYFCYVVRDMCKCDKKDDNNPNPGTPEGPNVPEECDASPSNCPIKWPGGPKAEDCLNAGQVPSDRTDLKCWTYRDMCICDKDNTECMENGWLDCTEQGNVPASRDDIRCSVYKDKCKCDIDDGTIDVPQHCADNECPITFPGGPSSEQCKEQGMVEAHHQIECRTEMDKCICDETVPGKCDSGKCPVTFPGGPSIDDCRTQGALDAVRSRDDLECSVVGGESKCYVYPDDNGNEPDASPCLDDNNCPITYPGSPNPGTVEDCYEKLGVSKNQMVCVLDGNQECSCDKNNSGHPDVPATCDAGNCPIRYVGGPDIHSCKEQGNVPASRTDIFCAVYKDKCICDSNPDNIPGPIDCDNDECPVVFPPTTQPPTIDECKKQVSGTNVECNVVGENCKCFKVPRTGEPDPVPCMDKDICPIVYPGPEPPTVDGCYEKLGVAKGGSL